ncbi:MAG: decarboxylating 6-phosphogluconate dehydrogenase [Armatimonadota bacterium]|nr:decarboxylating 6-phosphogluconate dehydrogenase [Armatimonadota bacterium]
MDLGMIGLGRMGANMTERLLRGGHRVVGYARTAASVQKVVAVGAGGASSLEELVRQLPRPRTVWLMVPSGDPVDRTVNGLAPLLAPGDVIVDGGNSYYRDSMRRAAQVGERGLHFVDVGTSGGIWGLSEGYSLMVGGDRAVVERLTPLFQTLAPAPDRGWGHVGPIGAGHFVKMVHNGIEYGMMQAIAEGFALMRKKEAFTLDLRQVAEIWRYGSVIRSWLLDLVARALAESPDLEGIAAYVPDSGEGRWTVLESLELEVAIPVITLALQRRFRSREVDPFGDRLLAALRQQFGGHAVRHAG